MFYASIKEVYKSKPQPSFYHGSSRHSDSAVLERKSKNSHNSSFR